MLKSHSTAKATTVPYVPEKDFDMGATGNGIPPAIGISYRESIL